MLICNLHIVGIGLALCLASLSPRLWARPSCGAVFSTSIELRIEDQAPLLLQVMEGEFAQYQVVEESPGALKKSRPGLRQGWTRRMMGASAVVGLMVATAATTTYFSQHLTGPTQFLSHFVLIASSMGIYRFGTIILEPLSARVQQKGAHFLHSGSQSVRTSADNHNHLAELWNGTQTQYSVNAQMSRNVLNSLLSKSHHQLRAAYEALSRGDHEYAAQQLALVAVDMRELFQEVRPNDPFVGRNVRSTILVPRMSAVGVQLKERVLEHISRMDSQYAEDPSVQEYYDVLLGTWLAMNWVDVTEG